MAIHPTTRLTLTLAIARAVRRSMSETFVREVMNTDAQALLVISITSKRYSAIRPCDLQVSKSWTSPEAPSDSSLLVTE